MGRAFLVPGDDLDITLSRIPGEPLTVAGPDGLIVAEFLDVDRVVLSTRVCPDPWSHKPLYRRALRAAWRFLRG